MEQPRPGVCKTAKVVRVEDADTIEVEIRVKFSIRLIGPGGKSVYLNSPEKDTEAGQRAIDRVVELLTSDEWLKGVIGSSRFKDVIIFIPERDPYELMDANSFSRLNGEVWVDGKRLGDILLEEGHATFKKR